MLNVKSVMTEHIGEVKKEVDNAAKFVDNWFTEYGLVSNIFTAVVYLALADFLVQVLYERPEMPGVWRLDFLRIGRSGLLALFMGFIGHFWYKLLDTAFPTTDLKDVTTKVGLDQIIGGAFFCSFYLFGMGLLDGSSLDDCVVEWSHKFPAVYKSDWMFWPFAQTVNFLFVPDRFRVLYVNVAAYLWNILLSYYSHRAVVVATRTAPYVARRLTHTRAGTAR